MSHNIKRRKQICKKISTTEVYYGIKIFKTKGLLNNLKTRFTRVSLKDLKVSKNKTAFMGLLLLMR